MMTAEEKRIGAMVAFLVLATPLLAWLFVYGVGLTP